MNEPALWLRFKALEAEYSIRKTKALRLLAAGRLRAKRLDGCTLIERASVDELLAEAPDWSPRTKGAA